MHYKYRPVGVCPFNLEFDIDDTSHVTNIRFDGGCNGNLKAVSKLCEGMTAAEIALGQYLRLQGHIMRGSAGKGSAHG